MTDNLSEALSQFPKGDVATATGASERTVRRWAAGSHEPTGTHLVRILSFLNRPENLKRLGRRRRLSFEEVFGQTGRAA